MKQTNILFILVSFAFLITYELNTCSEYFEEELKSSCEKYTGDSDGCQYLYGECLPKKDVCLEATSESECQSKTPYNKLYKCSYIDNKCTQVLKDCSEYIKGKTDCMSLSAGDSSKICVLKNGNCVPTQKICSEFTSGVEDPDFCLTLQPSNDKKICLYSSEKKGCVEKYKQCKYYEEDVFVDDRKKEECESIEYYDESKKKFDSSYKCVFDSHKNENTCTREDKECSDIKDKKLCFSHFLNKPNKECVFVNGICKEQYDDCKNADYYGCSSVIIFNEYKEVVYTQKCEWDWEYNECNTVGSRHLDCIKNLPEKECIQYNLESDYERCYINNEGSCISRYIGCPTNSEKEECNSISLLQSNEICIYNENTEECILHYKKCSEYKGTNEYICMNKYASREKDKNCFMENGRCVAKYIYCENYTETDAVPCRAIIPHDSYGNSLNFSYKCVVGDNKRCEMKRKECKDFKTIEDCQFFDISKTKNCVFLNGKCTEQYISCEDYSKSGEKIEESKCNSIVLKDETSRCVFNSGKCENKKKTCSDFNIANYLSKCSEMSANFLYKKCKYSNSICQDVNKTCLEITSKSHDDICENAKVSDPNTKRCITGKNFYCEEIDKIIYTDKTIKSGNLGFFKLSFYNFLYIIFVLIL